jgi:hypothetical protein
MPEDPQSFFRRWRIAIPVGVLLVFVLVLVREFVNYRSNSPIVDPYLAVINEMSLHSLRARRRLNAGSRRGGSRLPIGRAITSRR